MAYTQQEIQNMLRGRTKEQQNVIKYFLGGGGCLSGVMTDEQYDAMVMARVNSTNFKQKALNKLGLDESQVNEIEPVFFAGYQYKNTRENLKKWGKDLRWRSSAYQLTWLFFSDSQVYVYQYSFDMTNDSTKEKTEEYFYKDITNFSSTSESLEEEVLDKISCSGTPTYIRKSVNYDEFSLVVPGERLLCSMVQSDYTERAIQGMKAKLREKKG